MNKKNIISSQFQFFLDKGFSISYDNACNVIFTYSFTKDIAKVVISEDVRENYINLKLINPNRKTILLVEYGRVMENGNLIDLYNILSVVDRTYEEARNSSKGFTVAHFTQVVNLYSKLIESNLDAIIGTI